MGAMVSAAYIVRLDFRRHFSESALTQRLRKMIPDSILKDTLLFRRCKCLESWVITEEHLVKFNSILCPKAMNCIPWLLSREN